MEQIFNTYISIHLQRSINKQFLDKLKEHNEVIELQKQLINNYEKVINMVERVINNNYGAKTN